MTLISRDEQAQAPAVARERARPEENSAAAHRMNTSLKVAVGSSFVLRLAGASTGLLLSFYLKRVVQADAWLIGALAGIYYVTELLLAPVFGALSDLRGRKLFLVLGPVVAAIAVQIHPLTTVAAIIAMGRLLEGVSTAANAPGTLGYLADATGGDGPDSKRFRGRVMGLYEISFLIGLVGGNLLGGQLWTFAGPAAFRVLSIIYLAAAFILWRFVQESLPQQAREHHASTREAAKEHEHPIRALLANRGKAYLALLGEPALRSFVPAWLAINAVLGLWLIHVAPIMVKHEGGRANPFERQLLDGHLTPNEVGYALGGFGFFFVVGIYIWSHFYGRVRRTSMMLASITGLFIVTLALVGINNNIVPGPFGQWPLVPLLAVGILLESGFTPVALAYLADISETRVEHRGAVMGLYSVFLGIGQFAGGSTGGLFIVGYGFNGLLLATALLGAVAFAAVFYLRLRHLV